LPHDVNFQTSNPFCPSGHGLDGFRYIELAPTKLNIQKESTGFMDLFCHLNNANKRHGNTGTLDNHCATQLWDNWLVQLPGRWVSQYSANCIKVALQLPEFAQLSAVQCIQISLAKFLGNYVVVSSFLGVQSPTPLSEPQNSKMWHKFIISVNLSFTFYFHSNIQSSLLNFRNVKTQLNVMISKISLLKNTANFLRKNNLHWNPLTM
jgi:hypothetical protein